MEEVYRNEVLYLHTQCLTTYSVSAWQGMLLGSDSTLLTTENLIYSCTQGKTKFNHHQYSLTSTQGMLQSGFL